MPDKKPTSTVMKSILLIIAFASGIYGSIRFIDSRIEHATNDEQFIRRVSSHVRPYVIFDVNSSILADGGAMQYIENIETVPNEDNKITEIIITPKVHLPIAPILESLDEEFAITSKRGKKFQWIYEMGSINRIVFESSAKHSGINRFRIEIIK